MRQLLASPAVAAGGALLVLVEDSSVPTGRTPPAPGALAAPQALHAAWRAAALAHTDVVFATLDRSVSEANRCGPPSILLVQIMLQHLSKYHTCSICLR